MGRDVSSCPDLNRWLDCPVGFDCWRNYFMGVMMRQRKLRPDTIERYGEIYKLRQSGLTYQAIAEQFGFSRARAFAICKAFLNATKPEVNEVPQ